MAFSTWGIKLRNETGLVTSHWLMDYQWCINSMKIKKVRKGLTADKKDRFKNTPIIDLLLTTNKDTLKMYALFHLFILI